MTGYRGFDSPADMANLFMERCPSGRRGSPAKGVWGDELHRGFESLSFRHVFWNLVL